MLPPSSTRYDHYIDTGLAVAGTYWYRIRAFNWSGDSLESDESSIGFFPPAPPSFSAPWLLTTNAVHLFVQAGADAEGIEIERLDGLPDSPGDWHRIARLGGYVQYDDTQVMTNMTYSYRARAFNSLGDSISQIRSRSVLRPLTHLSFLLTL